MRAVLVLGIPVWSQEIGDNFTVSWFKSLERVYHILMMSGR